MDLETFKKAKDLIEERQAIEEIMRSLLPPEETSERPSSREDYFMRMMGFRVLGSEKEERRAMDWTGIGVETRGAIMEALTDRLTDIHHEFERLEFISSRRRS